MNKLTFPITESGYSSVEGNEAIIVNFETNLANIRAGKIGLVSHVKVSWVLDRTTYPLFIAFYIAQNKGSTPFLVDLLMDQKVLTEHVAVFIPGTFSLQNMDGLNYTVTSDLAVAPIWDPDAYTVAMFNYTGEIDLALLQEIAHLVHVHMVAGIPA